MVKNFNLNWKNIIFAVIISSVLTALFAFYSFYNEIFFVFLPERIMIKIILSALLAGFALSLVGTFVVHMKITTVGFCMSHAAFAGAALGLLLESFGSGINPVYMAAIFTIGVALLLGPLSDKTKLDSNIILGILFSLMIALGFIFISMMPEGVTGASSMGIIWGSLFGLSQEELVILIILNLSVILLLILFYKEFMSIMLNEKMALAAGINVAFFKFLILLATAVAVSFSINIVGAFLVYAMIVNPTSTVYQYVYDTKKLFIFSPIVGVVTILGGVYLSLLLDFPISSSIIVFSATIFALSVLISPKHKKVKRKDKFMTSEEKNINKIRKYFDDRAENWDDNVFHDPNKIEILLQELDLKKGETILDVGSGTGVMVPYLNEKIGEKGEIVAIDISEEMISKAKKKFGDRYTNLQLKVEDVNEIQYEINFDTILCYSCFPHFLDQEYTIKKMANLLKKQGRLMIAHSQSRDDINSLHKNVDGIVNEDRLPPMRKLKKMMEKNGLKIIKSLDNDKMFYIIGEKEFQI
ncbi:MAG: methyltransferase domain-containing protein [Candidatus Lokiarchaeota archaeon]|nr:methyltransferase domain-containing protein [Candidatus Lokiarchaeota archaeon]